MSSDVFTSLFLEKAELFRAAFSSIATELFYDQNKKRLRHAGEYGMYREAIVRDFLKFIIPRNLDISTGFLISSANDVSTQCDIVIFDSEMTPLYQEGDRQRFFPVESVFCVGEVKSTLSKQQFADTLNKLATVKSLGSKIIGTTILRKLTAGPFDPVNHPYDLFPSVLICQKLDFDLTGIENDIDAMYDSSIEHRHKHNIILSLEDGIFGYKEEAGAFIAYPRLVVDLKHYFRGPTQTDQVHLKIFGTSMFSLTSCKTLFYPDLAMYLGDSTSRNNIVRFE